MAVVALFIEACAGPVGAPAEGPQPADAAPAASGEDEWREIFDAAGWPDIGRATRVSSRSPSALGRVTCIEGWHVRTARGPIVLFDDLHVEWGAMFWEHWPASQRVPVDHYDDVTDLRGVRVARATGPRRRSRSRFVVGSPTEFLGQMLGSDCPRPASGPITPSHRLYFVARARWAEMLGHPEIAMAQREREPGAFEPDALRDDVARIVTEEAKWGLSRGMPRREARAWLERASSIVRTPERARAIEATLRDVGDDPPRWSAEPTIDELVAALADEPYYPARRWDDAVPRPSWARSGELQLASPAWELVARGWHALPALREAARSTRSTRRFHARITEEGVTTLVGSTVDGLALSVASSIAGRAFDDADAFDRWWLAVGVRGRSVALAAGIGAPDEHVALHATIGALVRSGDPLVWPAVTRVLTDRSYPRRADVLSAVAWALEREPQDARAPARDVARARALAVTHIRDAERDVRLAATGVLIAVADANACRMAADGLAAEARRGGLNDDDADEWWMLVDDLSECDPVAARRALRAAMRAPQQEMRDAAREWIADETDDT